MASTVADVLNAEGITVGPHDLVSPALAAGVNDGTEVVVRYGRKLTVTTDGRTSEHWTTALSVDEAVTQLGLRADRAKLSVSRSLPLGRTGLQLSAATRKAVTVTAAGRPATATTYATNVRELLAERRLTVGPLDRLSATLGTRLVDGAGVTLTRVQRKPVAAQVALPFTTTTVKAADLTRGTTRVKTPGRAGAARLTFVDTLVDGRRTARQATGRTVVSAPVGRVVLVGTKPVPVPQPVPTAVVQVATPVQADSGSIPSSGGLNWAALARCESSGNPRAVNPNGHYGLYQFSMQTWQGVGGSGNPASASVAEQTRRAQQLYSQSGAGQWSCGRHLFD